MSQWTNQNQLFISLPEDVLLAITAYGEAASDGPEGMHAVLSVIKNRTYFNEFQDKEILGLSGSVYRAVVLKYKQFSMFNPNTTSRAIAERMAINFDSEVYNNETLAKAYDLAQMLMSGIWDDSTGGATYYHATYVSPSWASGYQLTGQIGNQLFYADKSIPSSTCTAGFGNLGNLVGLGEISEIPITGLIFMGMAVGLGYEIIKRRKLGG